MSRAIGKKTEFRNAFQLVAFGCTRMRTNMPPSIHPRGNVPPPFSGDIHMKEPRNLVLSEPEIKTINILPQVQTEE